MSGMLERLRGLDAFPKAAEEFRVRTHAGGLVSLVGVAVMMVLLLVEAGGFFWGVEAEEEVVIDRALDEVLSIHFDITFPKMACEHLAVETVDASGGAHHGSEHDVFELPLDEEGLVFADPVHLRVPKAKGSFHFGPSAHIMQQDLFQAFWGRAGGAGGREGHTSIDMSHKIHALWFGDTAPEEAQQALSKVVSSAKAAAPALQGSERTVERGSLVHYYLKIVATDISLDGRKSNGTLQTHQYAVSEHVRPATQTMMPSLHFFYDTPPLRLQYSAKRKSWAHFFTRLSALIGGTYTLMGLVDRALHTRSGRAISSSRLRARFGFILSLRHAPSCRHRGWDVRDAHAESLAEEGAAVDGPADEEKPLGRRRRTLSSTRFEYCACGLTVFEQGPELSEVDASNRSRRRAFSLSGSARAANSDGSQSFSAANDHAKTQSTMSVAKAEESSPKSTSPPPSSSMSTPSSPLTSHTARTIAVHDIQVDIEDMVLAPGQARVKELAEATPKVRVSGETVRDRHVGSFSAGGGAPPVCRRCQRDDCLAVRPAVGTYTLEQVRLHASVDDCWIIAHGQVYDVTRYLHKHPGGMKSILSRAGEDCTPDYEFHTKFSKKKLWPKFKVGAVAVCKNRPAKPGSKPVYTTSASFERSPAQLAAAAAAATTTATPVGSPCSPGLQNADSQGPNALASSECGDRESTISPNKGISRASARRKNRPKSHLVRAAAASSPASKDAAEQEGCIVC
ncbi:Endoplasmic reticulum-Golgi intermediate compartment protein 3 [Hondaea fermentalgiana]|uniref:Endoplasmic reticulum-Golgi intermediate compartment protein 3 n=1 Tax=Hondaea fermentalgiana TaxID=2315210 RepID=A0A2R5GG67_9STRA|nr:Endoplasmic reticulum-Golgi intermediate compartment protein 3 [Hondaea fermentalgiana]|eukprot:GBG27643.1 Endoplasmic reticulum-Golgi intermediate compartment protein 3 [Hondaea fermentalgiana]